MLQVYLLRRVSSIVQLVRQLMEFQRLHLRPLESKVVSMELEVDRYLPILNREWEWELESGRYTFALLENSIPEADRGVGFTFNCVLWRVLLLRRCDMVLKL